MRTIDADAILCDGFSEWLACVMCGRATKEHPSCDGACDMQARIYADRAADALVSWLADVPTIEAEPVRHARLLVTNGWFYCGFCNSVLLRKAFCEDVLQPPSYCMRCGSKLIDEVRG